MNYQIFSKVLLCHKFLRSGITWQWNDYWIFLLNVILNILKNLQRRSFCLSTFVYLILNVKISFLQFIEYELTAADNWKSKLHKYSIYKIKYLLFLQFRNSKETKETFLQLPPNNQRVKILLRKQNKR